ncbi:MAG TPA: peptidoglycan-binding domain-containing protein [Candidatus Omnitrophota bacterium]|nr:peptidoglycan-binding domain-containing protein [Candidatus Omnitrophota bacterium]
MKHLYALAVVAALGAGPALAQGATPDQAVERQYLAEIQQQLKQSGYYQGQVDGVFGTQTSQALSQWQRDQGLPATGQIDGDTIAALEGGTATTQQAEVPESRTEEQSVIEQQRQDETLRQVEPDQQAEVPQQSDQDTPSDLQSLREEHMSAPNIQGETVPERPGTGTPAPGASPDTLESPPRD